MGIHYARAGSGKLFFRLSRDYEVPGKRVKLHMELSLAKDLDTDGGKYHF